MIVLVDDDVRFAEELHDLLALRGYRHVRTVDTPRDMGAMRLIDQACLLVIDLSLGPMTALDVLHEARERGSEPPAIILSGSGATAIAAARRAALDRGFNILGALPKPVWLDEFLELVEIAAPPPEPQQRLEVTRRGRRPSPAWARILTCGSLDYVGSHVRIGGGDATPLQPPDPITYLTCMMTSEVVPLLRAATSARRMLTLNGYDGFLLVRPPIAALVDPDIRASICTEIDVAPARRAKLTLEIGADALGCPALPQAMTELRRAGYGLLLRLDEGRLPLPGVIDGLPFTMCGIDPLATSPPDDGAAGDTGLRDWLAALRRRAIGSLCLNLSSSEGIHRARDLGFNLLSLLPDDAGALAPTH